MNRSMCAGFERCGKVDALQMHPGSRSEIHSSAQTEQNREEAPRIVDSVNDWGEHPFRHSFEKFMSCCEIRDRRRNGNSVSRRRPPAYRSEGGDHGMSSEF